MQQNWTHDDICMACLDGGQLLLCNLCPAAYHLKCIGAKKVQDLCSLIRTVFSYFICDAAPSLLFCILLLFNFFF
jgi:hypothetical protein